MRFTQDSTSGAYLIRGYGDGQLRINDQTYEGAVIVSARSLLPLPEVLSVEALLSVDAASILAFDPELLLLGTGARQVFPAPGFSAPYLRTGIGVEVMDTGAACRTYNVLIAEQRRAVALLLA